VAARAVNKRFISESSDQQAKQKLFSNRAATKPNRRDALRFPKFMPDEITSHVLESPHLTPCHYHTRCLHLTITQFVLERHRAMDRMCACAPQTQNPAGKGRFQDTSSSGEEGAQVPRHKQAFANAESSGGEREGAYSPLPWRGWHPRARAFRRQRNCHGSRRLCFLLRRKRIFTGEWGVGLLSQVIRQSGVSDSSKVRPVSAKKHTAKHSSEPELGSQAFW
jgi:hypothetical protein